MGESIQINVGTSRDDADRAMMSNSRCQCSEGMCQCLADCCGCCTTCPCGPDLDDENKPKAESSASGPTREVVDLTKIPDSLSPAPVGGCCAGNKGGNPVIAEVIEVSDEDSMDGHNTNAGSGSGTPLEQWPDDGSIADANASEPESKSCCSKKPKSQKSPAKLSPLNTGDQGGYFKTGPSSSSDGTSGRRPSTIEAEVHDGPQLSRAPSMTKANAKSHQPRPIMPRPASKKTQDAIAVVRSLAGVDHNIVVPRKTNSSGRTSAMSNHENVSSGVNDKTSNAPMARSEGASHVEQPSSEGHQTPARGPDTSNAAAIPNLQDLMAHLPFNPWTGLPNEQYVGSRTNSATGPSPAESFAGQPQTQAMPTMSQSPEFARLAALYLAQQNSLNQMFQQQNTPYPTVPQQRESLSLGAFPTGFPLPLMNEQDYRLALNHEFNSTNAGMEGVNNPAMVSALPMLQAMPFLEDQSSYSQQDPAQLDALFQRYLQGAIDGGAVGSDTLAGLGSQPFFSQNGNQPPQPVFGYPQESQDLQQM